MTANADQPAPIPSADEFARKAWGALTIIALRNRIRERDAAIEARARADAISECAEEIERYYQEEHNNRANLYGRISTGYDEGFLDGLDVAEQRVRTLPTAAAEPRQERADEPICTGCGQPTSKHAPGYFQDGGLDCPERADDAIGGQ